MCRIARRNGAIISGQVGPSKCRIAGNNGGIMSLSRPIVRMAWNNGGIMSLISRLIVSYGRPIVGNPLAARHG